jgi:hypothetical protein
MAEPTWDTPARIDGLPATNWKRRTGVTMDGTVADCITRWLTLAGHDQRNVTMRWGGVEGRSWTCNAIAAFVVANGLPPKLTAGRPRQPTKEDLKKIVSMPRYDPCPHAPHPAKNAHGSRPGGEGG